MDFRSDLPLERPHLADDGDMLIDAGPAPRAAPARKDGLRLQRYAAARHYALITSWWKARGSECLPADILPPTASLVVQGAKPVAACFIWLTNARAAYLAFPVSAPELSPHTAYRAVGMAIDGAIAIGREAGCHMIWAATASRSVDRLYSRAGLVRSSPHTNFFMLTRPELSSDMLTD